jgi:protein-L-isoaspartate(D-aspartate) O-methyltransferase
MPGNGRDNILDRAAELRAKLVGDLRDRGLLKSALVESAFRSVPRHVFLPGIDLDEAYQDEAIPVKIEDGLPVSSSSQPAIMALMLEQLDVRPGQHVLEIGAGTGYNAALLAHLVGDEGRVATVEIDEGLAEAARQHLAEAGNEERVEVVCDDGGYGYPEGAPYDRIIVTAAAWDITPSWWTQLKDGGRIVLPISLRGPQVSVAFVQRGDMLESASVEPCGFMELRGEFAAPVPTLACGPEGSIKVQCELRPPPDPGAVEAWLAGPSSDLDTGLDVKPRDLGRGVEPWLALQEAGYCRALASGQGVEAGLLPVLFGYGGAAPARLTGGVISESGLCLLMRPPHEPLPTDLMAPGRFRLWLRCCGDDPPLGERVRSLVKTWHLVGRPGSGGLSLRVYPARYPVEPAFGEFVLPKRWTKVVARWAAGIADRHSLL